MTCATCCRCLMSPLESFTSDDLAATSSYFGGRPLRAVPILSQHEVSYDCKALTVRGRPHDRAWSANSTGGSLNRSWTEPQPWTTTIVPKTQQEERP